MYLVCCSKNCFFFFSFLSLAGTHWSILSMVLIQSDLYLEVEHCVWRRWLRKVEGEVRRLVMRLLQ